MKIRAMAAMVLSVLLGTSSLHAQPTNELAESLRTKTGIGYIKARESLIKLPAAQAKVVERDMISEGGCDAIVGRALKLRREQPELAARFDSMVADAVAHVEYKVVDSPLYPRMVLSPTDRSCDPLAHELMLKRTDLPEGARWTLVEQLASVGGRTALDIDAALAMAKDSGRFVGELLIWAAARADEPDQSRVADAIVEDYQRVRSKLVQEIYWPRRLVVAISNIKSPVGLAAARKMVQIERDVMTAKGWAPWDDVTLEKDRAALTSKSTRAQVNDYIDRGTRRGYWNELNQAVSKLQSVVDEKTRGN